MHVSVQMPFVENSEEIVFLREMMTRHSDDPQRIHDDCRFAHSCVQDLVAKDIVADSFGVKRLLDTLSIAVTDIIANEPSVKNAVTARKAIRSAQPLQLTQANQTALLEHSQAAIDITTNQLGIELDEDAKDVAIVFGKKDKIDAVYRLISRWSRIYAKISSASKMQITDAVLGTFIQAQPHLEAILNILRPLLSGIA